MLADVNDSGTTPAKTHFVGASRIGISVLVLAILCGLFFTGCDGPEMGDAVMQALLMGFPSSLAKRPGLRFESPSADPDKLLLKAPVIDPNGARSLRPHCCETEKVYVERMNGTKAVPANVMLDQKCAGYLTQLFGIKKEVKFTLTGELREWEVQAYPVTHPGWPACCYNCGEGREKGGCDQSLIYYCCKFKGSLNMSEITEKTIDTEKAKTIYSRSLAPYLGLTNVKWETNTSIVFESEAALSQTREHSCHPPAEQCGDEEMGQLFELMTRWWQTYHDPDSMDIYVIYTDDLDGYEYRDKFAAEAAHYPERFNIVEEVGVTPFTEDLVPLLIEADLYDVDVFCSFTCPPTSLAAFWQAAELDISFKAIIFSCGANFQSFYDTFGASTQGVIGFGTWNLEHCSGQIGQWQSGIFEVIAPPELATADPIYPKPNWSGP